jgi:hypothetical protein
MRKLFPVAVLILGLFTGLASAAEERIDGVHWREKMDGSIRVGFVAGFLQGLSTSAEIFPAVVCGADPKASKECYALGYGAVDKYFLAQHRRVTYGQYVEGLDTFYSDYRNRQILVRYAMNYIGKAISGTPKAELEKMLEFLRQGAKN